MPAPHRLPAALLLAATLLTAACTSQGEASPAAAPPPPPISAQPAPRGSDAPFVRAPVVTTSGFEVGDGLEAWQGYAPVSDVRIPRPAGGEGQPAYWLPPADPAQGLLVVLHSWSTGYERGLGAPYAQWAAQRGWGMVAPDFQGANERPEATGSPPAVQDVLDALDWALREGGGDPERVYVVGLSGGGMMSLLAGSAAPERFAGVVAWAPVVDITDFYAFSERIGSERGYQEDIEASCGGDPTADPVAGAECARRSPAGVIGALREAGTPVYLGVGERDEIVPASQSVRAFNALADPGDALPRSLQDSLDTGVPPPGPADPGISFFTEQDPQAFLARRSAQATLVVFSGVHEMVYNPGLAWLSDVDARG